MLVDRTVWVGSSPAILFGDVDPVVTWCVVVAFRGEPLLCVAVVGAADVGGADGLGDGVVDVITGDVRVEAIDEGLPVMEITADYHKSVTSLAAFQQ